MFIHHILRGINYISARSIQTPSVKGSRSAVQFKHGIGRPCGGPYPVILGQIRVQQGNELFIMVHRRNPADGKPDTVFDEFSVCLDKGPAGGLFYFFKTDPVHSRGNNQYRDRFASLSMKTRDFAICTVLHLRAAAASFAVRVDSGNSLTLN